MMIKSIDTQHNIAAVSRLFASSVVQELAAKGRSGLFSRLAKESSITDFLDSSASVRDVYELAFNLLKKQQFRNEYSYKAAITQKVLLGKHNLNSAAMLTEFRVGKCKADVVILNGTSTVYEIKSERDSLSRLISQVDEYRNFFACVNVIVGQNHLDAVQNLLPRDVGIMVLTNRFNISTIRETVEKIERVNPLVIFESIRTIEAEKILSLLGIEIPDVPNTQKYSALRRIFSTLSSSDAHTCMIKVLKETRSLKPLSDLVAKAPRALQAAILTTPIRRMDHAKLVNAFDTPITEALKWT
ncbi:sce7726 family protein [Alkalimonas mucilaginosa]|uniref:Sce7726 family protein n=1 Tax=Alkalimonas mucilaginosa TaxID=3057676 RepID=A0ABU7JJQ6_9GAMM|nr:sce7726 family protein [Alkalimonas sp. MEB004]MEE2025934.1 sce7726 family protein [Alkalimonas sp. MEB004]